MTTFINHLRPDSGSHSSTSVSPRKLPRDKAANMNTNSMETYYGLIKTPTDAIKLFEACRLGLNPRVQRRLSEKERQMIRSGSVFVWDEREAGMRRWTDGKSWSASRVSGSFLTYREMEGKRGGSGFNGGGRRGAGKTPDSCRGSDEDQDDGEPDGLGYRYKADGLMKQSFSISTSTGQHLHLISYYTRNQTDLPQPSTDPQLRHITPPKGMYPESSMNDAGPPSTRAPMPAHYSPHNPPYMHTAWQQPPYWPHSPVSTPPYQQGPYAGGPPPYHHEQPQLPPLQQPQYGHPQQQPYHPPHPQQHPAHAQYQQHPHAHYPPHHHSAYHQGPLPHPQNHLPPLQHPYSAPSPAPSTLQPSHPTLPPPRSPPGPPHESPRSQQLQAKAREAVGNIEPLLANKDSRSYHGSQGPLPPLTMPTQHQTNGNSVTSAQQIPSPPSRTMSLSPQSLSDLNRNQNGGTAPSSAVSASKQPSLSVLLQPDSTPAASEPTSAHSSTSATSSSPRSAINPAHSSMPILAPIKSLTTGIPGPIGAGITVSNGINGASGKSYEGVVKQWAP